MTPSRDILRILGADANNLRNVDLEIALGSLTVVTGVSGSGKSSFLAQTLAAEGAQRNATFLGLSQPDLQDDAPRAFIGPMPPTALVGQRGFRPSIRTTVATATGLLALLRRLFVLEAEVVSDKASETVGPPSPDSYALWLSRHYRGQVEILAAPVRMQKTDGVSAVRRLADHGVTSFRLYSETDPPKLRETGRDVAVKGFKPLNPATAHSIEATFGRVRVAGPKSAPELRSRLQAAFEASPGAVVVTLQKSEDPNLAGPFGPRLDSGRNLVHPDDPETFLAPSRSLLSFNAPSHVDSGACLTCAGTGVAQQVDLEALIPRPELSMADGAFALWTHKNYKHLNIQHETIRGLAGRSGFDPARAWRDLPVSARELILQGSGDDLVQDIDDRGRKYGAPRPFRGFVPVLLDKASGTGRAAQQLADLVRSGRCPDCHGSRWSRPARALRVAGLGIDHILNLPFDGLADLSGPEGALAEVRAGEARGLVAAIRKRAEDVCQVGLPYLSADRGMLDVSDGESRRLRIARVLAPDQAGLCLLLDEPGRGLHEADLGRLGAALGRLRGRHTVILNEHRQSLWPVADRLIAFGPGAGPAGGALVQDGPPPHGAPVLRDVRVPSAPPPRADWLRISGVRHHNIRGADVALPAGRLTTICGVSGSGKSSFVNGVLKPLLDGHAPAAGRLKSVTGLELLGEVVVLDQSVPPPNRRSLVATLTGVFEAIRKAFAATEAARRDGLGPSDFGLNAGKGRCPSCDGLGSIASEDRSTPCPACGGTRYGPAVLAIRVEGLNIGELLDTPVDRLPEAVTRLFKAGELLSLMGELGVGHIAMGRRIDTLSGGELQRLRLAIRLASSKGRSTFVLDEPAAGLHADDVQTLILALDRALDKGRNTIVIVEHDLQVIGASDWLVEFGPCSGPDGGEVVYQGVVPDLIGLGTATALALSGRLRPVPGPAAHPISADRPGPASSSDGLDRARRTLAALRTLTTGDVPASEDYDPIDERPPLPPAMVVTNRLWLDRTPAEAASLDQEAAKIMLDVHRHLRRAARADLLDRWAAVPDAQLRINPFVDDMRLWGGRLPRSALKNRLAHLHAEGLSLCGAPDSVVLGDDPGAARASGDRFKPPESSAMARATVLEDALTVGGGYVELWSGAGPIAAAGDRLVALPDGLVAPLAPVPSDFSRHTGQGRCPACKGRRHAPVLNLGALIGRPDLPPSNNDFLTQEAEAVLKSVRRTMLLPFLKTLAAEGLWALNAPFSALDADARGLLLHGDWRRPGPGTFLKSPKSDPGEVSSWLRWNGLFREVLDQAERSPDKAWADRLRAECHMIPCETCSGTGLQRFARLLSVGTLPFSDWSRAPVPEQIKSLKTVAAPNGRSEAGLDRILTCLSPEAGAAPDAETVARRMARGFTTLDLVEPNQPEPA